MIFSIILNIILAIMLVGLFLFVKYVLLGSVLVDIYADAAARQQVENIFPCDYLLIEIATNSTTDGFSYDFSRYEEFKVIGMTIFTQRTKDDFFDHQVEIAKKLENRIPADDLEDVLDEALSEIIVVPDTYIYQTKEGTYHWLMESQSFYG
jgi:hypothetical protein